MMLRAPSYTMSANRLTRPKQMMKCHGRSGERLLTGGARGSAKDPTLDAKVVANAVRHRQVSAVQLGGVGLEGHQEPCPRGVDQTRPAQGCATSNRQGGSCGDDLLEQLQQMVKGDSLVSCTGAIRRIAGLKIGRCLGMCWAAYRCSACCCRAWRNGADCPSGVNTGGAHAG
jgi:hypothetical protein